MLTKIKNRFKNDRADANSVSQILWIAIAAAVISVVGLAIFRATKSSGNETAARIQNSECYLRQGKPCTMTRDKFGNIGYDYRYEKLGE